MCCSRISLAVSTTDADRRSSGSPRSSRRERSWPCLLSSLCDLSPVALRSGKRTRASYLDRKGESRMNKPRIFLGSSGKQAKLLQAITRGLEDVADVEPWTTTFNPGRSTLDRLAELSQEVDFAAFVFAQDDWTTTDASQSGQASPR